MDVCRLSRPVSHISIELTATEAVKIVPRSVLGGVGYVQPSDMVNIVGVGVGGRGASDIHEPSRIQASSSLYSVDYLPAAEWVIYEFPARGNMPPVSLTWVDG